MWVKDIFNEKLKHKIKEKINIPQILILVIIVYIVFSIFVVGIAPTSSMEPNIYPKDLLIANKLIKDFKRGDVVIFKHENQIYCKRIIGLPGDNIIIVDGSVYINGQPLKEPYIKEPIEYIMEEVEIPKEHYFVLGDNRNDSEDSYCFGPIKNKDIIGKVILKFNFKQGFDLHLNKLKN